MSDRRAIASWWRRDHRSKRSRGAVLFEVVLAVALFGGAAAFTLAAVRSVFAALQRISLQQEAVDLAKSKIAELEAGLITLADLRGESTAHAETTGSARHDWEYDLKTRRTEFSGLTLVELTVRQKSGVLADAAPMSFTLRQLVALRSGDSQTLDQEEPANASAQ